MTSEVEIPLQQANVVDVRLMEQTAVPSKETAAIARTVPLSDPDATYFTQSPASAGINPSTRSVGVDEAPVPSHETATAEQAARQQHTDVAATLASIVPSPDALEAESRMSPLGRRLSSETAAPPAISTPTEAPTPVFGPLYDPAWWTPGKCSIPYDEALRDYCTDVGTEEQLKAKPMCTVSKTCSFHQGGTYVKPLSVVQLDTAYKALRDRIKGKTGSDSCTADTLTSRSDGSMNPLTFSKLAPFELAEVQGCPIHHMSPMEAIAVLRKVGRGRPIVYSGDSLIRQPFHRLVTFLRGSNNSIDPSHFHTDIVYVIGTKGDDYSVLPDAVVELFPKNYSQALGNEYVGGFDYKRHLSNVSADIGDPLVIMHCLWNTYMHSPRTAPILALQPKTVVTSWNYWFPPESPELEKQLADSLAWWQNWLKEDENRTVVWPLGHLRLAKAGGAPWIPWIVARNQIVAKWRTVLSSDLKKRFLLIDNEAQQHFGDSKFEPCDGTHYASTFHTACTIRVGHLKEIPTWCSSAEFAAGGKVVAHWFGRLMRDQFNLNLGQWALNHMFWRMEREVA